MLLGYLIYYSLLLITLGEQRLVLALFIIILTEFIRITKDNNQY